MLHVYLDFRGFDGNRLAVRGVKEVDRDVSGIVVVNDFGVIFLVTQLDQVASMRALAGMRMLVAGRLL